MEYWTALVRRYYGVDVRSLFLDEMYSLLKQIPRVRMFEAGIDPDAMERDSKAKDAAARAMYCTPARTDEDKKRFEQLLAGLGLGAKGKK